MDAQRVSIEQIQALNAQQVELLSRYQITTLESLYGQIQSDPQALAALLGLSAADIAELERQTGAHLPSEIRQELEQHSSRYPHGTLPQA